jgi:hypothetical protein
VLQLEMTKADSIIRDISGTVRPAASKGDDGAQIMPVCCAGFDGKPPELNAPQQKVFDALKAHGLDPSISNEQYQDMPLGPMEWTWVIKANWKDEQK